MPPYQGFSLGKANYLLVLFGFLFFEVFVKLVEEDAAPSEDLAVILEDDGG